MTEQDWTYEELEEKWQGFKRLFIALDKKYEGDEDGCPNFFRRFMLDETLQKQRKVLGSTPTEG